MQHTETYNLNLIETSDTFSPDPLNQNAQALEDALSDEADARESADSALDARLKVFEAKHVKVGMYTAPTQDAVPMTLNLGFTPKAVFAISGSGTLAGALYSGYSYNPSSPVAKIVPGGIQFLRAVGSSGLQVPGNTYIYLALD